MPATAKIVPHLWYANEAEEAAAFYTSIFPDSRIDRITTVPTETPSGPPGSVKAVDFTIAMLAAGTSSHEFHVALLL
jgi:predicted 3-demethylubiquinone-9 3-methyltransferase (glyoxalase superfamily)